MDDLPRLPGSYALQLYLPQAARLQVGRLGWFDFTAGHYVYMGSAMGSGGLRARLGRHLRGGSRLHWHIDVLRAVCQVSGYTFEAGSQPLECTWSRKIAGLGCASVPVPGFGASDCRSGCASHLVYLGRDPGNLSLQGSLAGPAAGDASGLPGHPPAPAVLR